MKNFTLSAIFLMVVHTVFGQCDHLLSSKATDLTTCSNEWISIDLEKLENRTGGSWSSSTGTNFGSKTLKGILTESQTIYYLYTDNNAPCTATDSFMIKVNEKPRIQVQKPSDVCENGPDLQLTAFATPLGGTWFDTTKLALVKGADFYPANSPATAKEPRFYQLFYRYTDATTQCSDTAETQIAVKPLPVIKLKSVDYKLALKDSMLLLDTMVKLPHTDEGIWSGLGVGQVQNHYYFLSDAVKGITGRYEIYYTYTDPRGPSPHCSNNAKLVLHLTNDSVSTLVQKIEYDELAIFPNPGSGSVNLALDIPFSYAVYNLTGKMVTNQQASSTRATLNLEKGMYIVVVKTDSGAKYCRKIMVK
ncbi:T9SS type A sorting domain-containing protein [bacterium]|nr:T9SS type A sorting domain-containing protein [bacterium]